MHTVRRKRERFEYAPCWSTKRISHAGTIGTGKRTHQGGQATGVSVQKLRAVKTVGWSSFFKVAVTFCWYNLYASSGYPGAYHSPPQMGVWRFSSSNVSRTIWASSNPRAPRHAPAQSDWFPGELLEYRSCKDDSLKSPPVREGWLILKYSP